MVNGEVQPPEFLPLRALANVITVLLVVVVASIAVRLAIQVLGLGSPHWRLNRFDAWLDITIISLAILFVVWFRRARIDAEGHGYRQRRARGWAFWGWIVPIVNLWFPFQLMGDIWRAGLPPDQRRKTAWLPTLWWTCWLLSGVSFGRNAMSANSGVIPRVSTNSNGVSLVLLALAGLLLIAIVRTVSRGPVGSPCPSDAYLATPWPPLES